MSDNSEAGAGEPELPEPFPSFSQETGPVDPIFGTLPDPLRAHPLQASSLPRRGRARSNTLTGGVNPLEFPVTPAEHSVANLARSINRANQRSRQAFQNQVRDIVQQGAEEERQRKRLEIEERRRVKEALTQSGTYRGTELTRTAAGFFVYRPRGQSIDRNKTPTQDDYPPANTAPTSQTFRGFGPSSSVTPPLVSSAASTSGARSVELAPAHATSGYSTRRHGIVGRLSRPEPEPAQSPTLETPTPVNRSTGDYSERRRGVYLVFPPWEDLVANRGSPRIPEDATFEPRVLRAEIPTLPADVFQSLQGRVINMNYQNYLDSSQSGPGSSPRQAPPSPSQGMNHTNGMNGAMGLTGGMLGFPTPAGHQSDLNFIMQMVEELAGQLAHNQGLTAGIVDKMGKVRAKAKNLDLTNDELIAVAASELNESSENLEKENSELRKALDKALYDKKEDWKLAVHGANILSDILDKMHKFKLQHESDTLAWHRNYRKQLADEREENLNLRNQINDMKAAACRANEHLRQMRRYLTDHDELNELRIRNIQLRQERRVWKRMALPLIPDDDSEWSDDDDVIDPEEKKRRAALEAEKERKEREGGDGDDAQGPSS